MTAANENRTHIYRIRRKEDGLYMSSAPQKTPHPHEYWDSFGTFFRQPETIRKHLLELCQFRMYDYSNLREECKQVRDLRKRHRGHRQKKRDLVAPFFIIAGYETPHRIVKTVYEWLDKYEVVATEITVHGENVMEARDFASFLGDKDNTVEKTA